MHSRQSIIFFLFSIRVKYEWKSVNSEIYCLRYQDICCSIHRKMVNEQPYTYLGCLGQLNALYELVYLYDKLDGVLYDSRISNNQCKNFLYTNNTHQIFSPFLLNYRCILHFFLIQVKSRFPFRLDLQTAIFSNNRNI